MKSVLIAYSENKYSEKLKERLLMSGKFNVITAGDGEEALKSTETHLPDILLLGMFMQKKDGLSVLFELKERGITEKICIFVLTPKVSDEIMLCLQKYNVRHIFIMPADTENIEKHIDKYLGFNRDKNKSKAEKKLEATIAFYLNRVGISARLKGYSYLKKVVSYSVRFGTNKKYTEILKLLSASSGKADKWKSIDRNIRTAIESAWINGSIEEQHGLFGYSISPTKGRPTNKEFCAMITQRVRESLAYRR